MSFCLNCNKQIHKNKTGYCITCLKIVKDKEKIEKWLKTGDTSCAVGTTLRNGIREYIYRRQNYSCAICGIKNFWNEKPLNFVLDHINGDASNNFSENLRLICPNCDAQLDTFKSKNKESARKFRKKYG